MKFNGKFGKFSDYVCGRESPEQFLEVSESVHRIIVLEVNDEWSCVLDDVRLNLPQMPVVHVEGFVQAPVGADVVEHIRPPPGLKDERARGDAPDVGDAALDVVRLAEQEYLLRFHVDNVELVERDVLDALLKELSHFVHIVEPQDVVGAVLHVVIPLVIHHDVARGAVELETHGLVGQHDGVEAELRGECLVFFLTDAHHYERLVTLFTELLAHSVERSPCDACNLGPLPSGGVYCYSLHAVKLGRDVVPRARNGRDR